MNAYELADWMENAIISDDWGELAKYYGWCNQHIPTMLRQQADRIAVLEGSMPANFVSKLMANDVDKDALVLVLKDRIAELEKQTVIDINDAYEAGKLAGNTHPVKQLSDEEIIKVCKSEGFAGDLSLLISFARAIIKEITK